MRKPPSFLRNTPGLTGFAAIHEFHLLVHFVSMRASDPAERRTWTSERHDSTARAGQERI
jgi:hypothetical protein